MNPPGLKLCTRNYYVSAVPVAHARPSTRRPIALAPCGGIIMIVSDRSNIVKRSVLFDILAGDPSDYVLAAQRHFNVVKSVLSLSVDLETISGAQRSQNIITPATVRCAAHSYSIAGTRCGSSCLPAGRRFGLRL